jgi:hypothetical protein
VERGTLKRRRWVLALLAAALVAAGGSAGLWRWRAGSSAARGALPTLATEVRAPDSVRVRVQVLNATRTRGLGRRATRYLRDRGFDVVEVGTSRETRDSTLVLDRSGHPEWAALVGELLGGAPVEARPDSSRYLDVTVLIGASWRPPAEPFYP